jgi:1-acyl-sn-glycerol-3-phosphate acyltransferase
MVTRFARELNPRRCDGLEVSLLSRLDRDLGIDSLSRAELILRIERRFGVRLPDRALGESETVADVLSALERAQPHRAAAPAPTPEAEALPVTAPPSEARTLIEVLEWHVARHADRHHIGFIEEDARCGPVMTYGALAEGARAVATGLIARDVAPGDRVALMLPTGQDFFHAFFGILYAGAVPVPIYPPMRPSQFEDHLRRQARILANAGACVLVTVPEGLRVGTLLRGQVETLRAIETVDRLQSEASPFSPPRIDPTATALIQYTSGSTGDPKGVVLSHANLLANIRALGRAMDASSRDIFVSWLPLYHDLGLIGAWLGTLYFAAPLYVMSPVSFLAHPGNWLWAIHHVRATLSASPNFGFELCLNKLDDADLAGLDLSSLRIVANGAEPVSPSTLRRFIERFSRYGFRREAMAPVYGLAECTVGLAFPPPGRGPVIDRIDREALVRRGLAQPARPDDSEAMEIVACGHPLPGHEIRIVDDLGQELGERREGRLQFRGPSATAGYFRNEAATRDLIRDGWHDSGDRAYLAGGDVFITGRAKDVLIRAGRNIYPQEVEQALGEIPGIRKGCVAAFGIEDATSGTERLVIMAETVVTDTAARERLQQEAHRVATDVLGMPPDEIVLIRPRTIPKTSSGKIRRSAARDLYRSGRIGERPRPLWLQIARLWLGSAGARSARLISLSGDVAYAFWWWAVIATGFVIAWFAVMVVPGLERRWRAVRAIARAALTAVGIRVTINGVDHLRRGNAVLVFNHSSYMDAVALTATLPGAPAFIAKRELARQVFAGPMLRRLGVVFVERYDPAASIADSEAVIRVAREGRLLVIFPEGTFTRREGLAGFYLGAFKVAAEAGLPVIPGIIRGTRTVLRGEQWFPRRSAVAVEIDAPVAPSGADFASILKLRDQVRAVMLSRSGEPDLGELTKPRQAR